MRKICVSIIGGFIMFSAFGVGENVPTSKSYIDSELVEKQDTIERTTGNNQALTNTGTAAEYGTKDIYDSTGSYTEQTDALIDAQTMNAAVQNAINAEFVCISWVDDDPTKDCLLMEIRGTTEKLASKNVFDVSQLLKADGWTENNGVYTGNAGRIYLLTNYKPAMEACSPSCKPNTQYTLSYTLTIDENAQFPSDLPPIIQFYFVYSDGQTHYPPQKELPQLPGETRHIIQTSLPSRTLKYIKMTFRYSGIIHVSNMQLEEGTIATPYQPYENLYLPAGN